MTKPKYRWWRTSAFGISTDWREILGFWILPACGFPITLKYSIGYALLLVLLGT